MQLEEKVIKVGRYELKIRELTVEKEANIKADCRIYDRKMKQFKIDYGARDASIIFHSVVEDTWPSEFGVMDIEEIKKLPSKYFRQLLVECEKLNSIREETTNFLEEQSSSQTNPARLEKS